MKADKKNFSKLSPERRALIALTKLQDRVDELEREKSEPIAIIGIGCRFPGGAKNPEVYWQLLRDGVDAVREVPSERWDIEAYYDPDPETPGKMYSRWGAFLKQEEVEKFDPEFFGISPREAQGMDPQQRLLLEISWEALENAAQVPEKLVGSQTGVFIGVYSNDYHQLQIQSGDATKIDAYLATGNAHSVAVGRLSYVFGFQGPSMPVDTACSSSLVAVHLACQSLRNGECNLALAGGVNLILSPDGTISECRARMLSADGRCKTFDAAADGFVRGEGGGIVVLKRFSDAVTDGNNILAVIRGSAVNQDGASSGLTAPSELAQEEVVQAALSSAGVKPAEVSYIEAHGTGTSLGDPIEVQSLGAVLSEGRKPEDRFMMGSVKTNFGHLEGAAGIAGLIKVVLALQHKEVPPHLHFNAPNPHISWKDIPAMIPTKCTPWSSRNGRRIAGVSSFGLSGTNAHVILEEAPRAEEKADERQEERARDFNMLTLSAKSEGALRQLVGRYIEHLQGHAEQGFGDICYTANVGRSHFNHRLMLVAKDRIEAVEILKNYQAGKEVKGLRYGEMKSEAAQSKIMFRYSDEGTEQESDQQESQQESLQERIIEIGADPNWQQILSSVAELYIQGCDIDWERLDRGYRRKKVSLPTYPFQRERYWIEGTRPRNRREIAFSHEDSVHPLLGCRLRSALREVQFESHLNTGTLAYLKDHRLARTTILPAAAYLEMALAAAEETFGPGPHSLEAVDIQEALILPDDDNQTVQLILSLEDSRSAAFQVFSLRDDTKHNAMAWTLHASGKIRVGQADTMTSKLESVSLEEIQSRCQEAQSGNEVYQHLKERGLEVRAAFQNIHKLWRKEREVLGQIQLRDTLVPEMSSYQIHPVLLDSFIQLLCSPILSAEVKDLYLPVGLKSLRLYSRPGSRLWGYARVSEANDETGEVVSGDVRLFDENGQVVGDIEGLCFKRVSPETLRLLQHKRIENWFYEIKWETKLREATISQTRGPGRWLIFADRNGVGDQLVERLKKQGQTSIVVSPGKEYKHSQAQQFQIRPEQSEDFEQLWREVLATDGPPVRGVIHFWGLDAKPPKTTTVESLHADQVLSCGSALHLVQALVKVAEVPPPRLFLVTRGSQPVSEKPEPVELAQAPLWGLGKVIALEHPELQCTRIDLDPEGTEDPIPTLFEELWSPNYEDQIAFRGSDRFVARLAQCSPEVFKEKPKFTVKVCAEDTYLITGGLGGLGLTIAQWMVEQGARHLVLMGRHSPSKEAEAKLDAMKKAGADVMVAQADVSQEKQLDKVLTQIRQSMSPLKGIIHAAGVLDDGVLLQQEWQRFEKVMDPKVAGAWNLHTLTEDTPLDFFVLFSSVASLLGSPGQGNYVAANAFLDALAHLRRAQGKAALSINWGAWAEVGMAADTEKQRRRTSHGMALIAAEQGLQAMEQGLHSSFAQLGVLPVEGSEFLRQFPGGEESPFISDLAREFGLRGGSRQLSAERLDFIHRIKENPPHRRRALLVTYVRHEVCNVLGLDSSRSLDSKQGLTEIGLDSLMAVELRNRLQDTLGCNLPMTLMFEQPTIEAIAEYLFRQVLSSESPSASHEKIHKETDEKESEILADITKLSEKELKAAIRDEYRNMTETTQK